MNFIVYDLIFLVFLVLTISFFLYKNKKNLGIDGPLILYRTQWGIKFIEYIGGKYKKTLSFLSYISIALGYFLMLGILYLIIKTVWEYLFNPQMKDLIGNAPPLAPVIPYFPQLFGLSDFFPAFYVIYFLIAILITMTVHEMSHGFFMKRYGIKIKSTGFAFLKYFPGVIGAFVEQDEKSMKKAKKSHQMAVLSAGVFANFITAILFFIGSIYVFSAMFVPAGVGFNTYAYDVVPLDNITSVNGVLVNNPSLEQFVDLLGNDSVADITTNYHEYYGIADIKNDKVALYFDSPAIRNEIVGAINEINGKKVMSLEGLSKELERYNPGDKIEIKTNLNDEIFTHEIVLGENPNEPGKAYLGIAFMKGFGENSLKTDINHFLSASMKKQLYIKSGIYYKANYPGISEFVYYLFWWIIMINFLVALFNMIPAWIFDGGRFFYLTIWGITGKENFGKKVLQLLSYLFLLMLVLIMSRWLFGLVF